ncbi:ATPase family associated with various cellular activities (AAA) domain-containing protein [Hirsutella rhossiliensis]|uniref:ATPase family associated with various cellular activities (AAA) domain-containing protein n=1 Tax=Hirsutella rhossiliensis TaxID=111463 RepID=A0A9P8MYC5_9HYPO|nr:ATPase family associated with various cellular activities (AAA) domain-containing protein [Hirsutella rhossiliensis]KAH0961392.1 ATPase family associated with various cellular activities (AAA) domain-containing protein [Hirsutella rhossiliensis]
MAQGGVEEPSSEKLHPFFIRGAGSDAPSTSSEICTASSASGPATENPMLDSGDDDRRKKRRKTESSPSQAGSEAKKIRRRRRKNEGLDSPSAGAGIISHLVRADPSPLNTASMTATPPDGNADLLTPLSDTLARQPTRSVTAASTTNAKLQDKSQQAPKQSKGPSMVVCIRYGRDDQTRQAIGAKVTQILSGELQILSGELQIPSTPTRKRGVRASAVPKNLSAVKGEGENSLHPFFTGRSKPPPPSEQSESVVSTKKNNEPKCSVFMSTPVSPRKPRKLFASDDANKAAQFGMKSPGTKIPGAMLPMWPAAGMSHVRGGDGCSSNGPNILSQDELCKKSKGYVITITPPESLLTYLVDQMHLDSVRKNLPRDEGSFAPAPAELRLPRRRFESGRRLQNRIRSRLAMSSAALTTVDDSSQDELSSLPTTLSAFDKSSCEGLSWTQKYAPATAAQVLQTGKETSLLKQWLEALKVQSVESGGDTGGDKKAKSETTLKKKKRKAKLEGFVVDSDDEASELGELSDVEDDGNAAGSGLIKRSVIRAAEASSRNSRASGRLRNTVVISGPHGCGKTASVYAVAKELGFEIFELNPGSRRSGKDILEKVGDMTRNHLVQHHRAQAAGADGETDEPAEHSNSAKQGMMTSFFKPKPTANVNHQSQKQSLILLEEADVLYEEDKQFWTTLMTMMMQSKRPFVVTCNDENLIPIQSLSLHGIFRFSAPPASLAVDLCLLIAANEGHALGRLAVESLYRSRGEDLRATISELNFWCQIGIGDRKGGFDWFYPRWPKGSDLDDNGDVVRVISDGTYLHGMGWIGRDLIATTPEPLAMEEEALRQAWNSWQMDMGDWCDSHDATKATANTAPLSSSLSNGGIKALAAYEDFCGVMSDADICSRGAFGSKLEEQMDPTLPELATGARDDFIVGLTLLQADAAALPTPASAAEAITIKSFARQVLLRATTGWSTTGDDEALAPVDEGKAVSVLDSSFQARRHQLTRQNISLAFDPIAVSAKAPPSSHLDPSVFDRPMKPIILDVAPWVRGIIAFEHRLMQERLKLSSLLSEGGVDTTATARKKRMRTTRSAYSALEGSERRTTRRERYFGNSLVTGVVMRTGAASFQDAAAADRSSQGDVLIQGQSPYSPRTVRSESP